MKNSTILIVDDSPDNIIYLKAVLKGEGFKFFEAINGEEGVIVAKEKLPDLILMDALMPIMDGFEATKILKTTPETERIPILMITALQDRENRIKALNYGVTDFISKPFDKTELIARCRSLANMSKLNQKYVLAASNPLTNLPNKIALIEDIQNSSKPKLFILEIDSFEEYADFYGFDESERLELFFSQMLKEILATSCLYTTKLYHITPGKFAILIDDKEDKIDVAEGEEICKRLEKLSKKYISSSENQDFLINFTIGFAFEQNRLIERASLALTEAKKQKKDFLYDTQILEKVNFEIQNNLFWVKKLQKSIEEDRIVPFFQPILNNYTKKIEKFEALIRLIKEDGTVVTPIHFLEVSKKSRYYNKLTKIILQKCIQTLSNIDFDISINISTLDIEDELMHEYILELLHKNKDIAKKLVFEILESESIEKTDMFSTFIKEVKLIGSKIAMDDFGSGYSNFTRLLNLDIDYLKIDGSLIANITTDKSYEYIVKMICDFASKREIKVVAEFVKNKEIYQKVLELGIDYSQGYFISPPIKDINELNIDPKIFD